MLEKIQFHTAISEQLSDLPTGSQLEDFCKDFYVTKSSGKEGKAWGQKLVVHHHHNQHNIYSLTTSNIVEISNCKKREILILQ